ncbi:CsgG/HfaB family protein [Pseudoxanthomonas wuyuanensis]|uniref:Curli biogenesis system outer membrane secretion channel CsgG n=1 Tax=Pseudoxanthomonas wuyuanensis TaxID=1073196 RepID=A0A286D6B6_9GAMM|nr:CsgG/HfaB family protein [Pseudoxanthomonas wuyuanensis]KAF1721595.1 peptidoglycan-binding protein [Pseudoxanthomonas wuyuanensis]SOD54154.1 Curli biogenesis system outer membrane secretion channel CsgG [Pseudoxanthomonas wuyuanensis]
MHKLTFKPAVMAAFVAAAALAVAAAPASAQRKSAQETRKQQVAEIPVCAKSLGTISVIEPEDTVNWWSGQQLPAPSKLIKVFVNKSRCFTLVDRGTGMAAMQYERELASSGELRGRSNVGKGQIKAADYVLVPDLISQNSNAGGNAIGGLLGGLIGGKAGAIASGLNFKSKTADVVLTVTDVRSSEQVAMAEGNAKKTDIGWGAAGGLFSGGGFGAAGAGGYANTEIGQVITLAYLQAYTDLIAQLGGLPDNASAANAQQAVTVTKPGRLLANAAGTGKAVRTLDPGMMLYPTGTKEGVMWEVEDELGNKGWVSSTLLELSK